MWAGSKCGLRLSDLADITSRLGLKCQLGAARPQQLEVQHAGEVCALLLAESCEERTTHCQGLQVRRSVGQSLHSVTLGHRPDRRPYTGHEMSRVSGAGKELGRS